MEPINSGINSDELVTITNKSTKQVKRVKRADLPTYGLPLDYQSQADIYAKSVMEGRAQTTNIPEDYRGGAMTVLNENKFQPEVSAKQKESKVLKDSTLQAAKAMQTVLDNKDSYATPKAYEDAKKYAASRLSSATGFGEGGKVLSAAELGILSGSLINIKPQRQQNILERITGDVPPATGEITDDEETIRNKMRNAIGYLTTGKLPDPKSQATRKANDPLKRILAGAGKEIKDMADAVVNMPSDIVNNPEAYAKQATMTAINPQLTMSSQVAPALIKSLDDTTGNILQGGGVEGIGGRILDHAQDKPIETATWALPPILKGVGMASKGLGGVKAIEGAEGASVARAGVLPEIGASTKVGTDVLGDMLKGGSEWTAKRINGAGPSKYTMQNVNLDNVESLNKALLDEGVVGAMTKEGKSQAIQRGLTDSGRSMKKLYLASPETVDSTAFGDSLKKELLKTYGPSQAQKIDEVISDIQQVGEFNMAEGKQYLTMDDLHNMEVGAGKYGLKQAGLGEIGAVNSPIAKDVSRIIGNYVDSKVPEAIPDARRYRNLKVAEELAKDSEGYTPKGLRSLAGLFSWVPEAGATLVNKGAQVAYDTGKAVSPDSLPTIARPESILKIDQPATLPPLKGITPTTDTGGPTYTKGTSMPTYIRNNETDKLLSTKNMSQERYQEIVDYNKTHPLKTLPKIKAKKK